MAGASIVVPSTAQGQSIATLDKERRIGSAYAVSMRVFRSKPEFIRKYRYHHLDANAGSGWNDLIGVPGSPIIFHQNADTYLREARVNAFFCDRRAEAIETLRQTLGEAPHRLERSRLLNCDNEIALQIFAEEIAKYEDPRFAIGSVLADSNGYFFRNARGEGPPIHGLYEFARRFPRMDIVLNLNLSAYYRQRAAAHCNDVAPPSEVLASLGKGCWLVAITAMPKQKFLLAVGRNVDTGGHASLGLHRLSSPRGRALMLEADRLGVVAPETAAPLLLPSQLGLF